MAWRPMHPHAPTMPPALKGGVGTMVPRAHRMPTKRRRDPSQQTGRSYVQSTCTLQPVHHPRVFVPRRGLATWRRTRAAPPPINTAPAAPPPPIRWYCCVATNSVHFVPRGSKVLRGIARASKPICTQNGRTLVTAATIVKGARFNCWGR